jgi:hypothetical protein
MTLIQRRKHNQSPKRRVYQIQAIQWIRRKSKYHTETALMGTSSNLVTIFPLYVRESLGHYYARSNL